VVKVSKPQQDMRFDVPTIGVGTLETMLEAGGEVLAVEAGKTILLDQKEVIEFADRHKMVVMALVDGEMGDANRTKGEAAT
jgi:UDP-2,3-diacylglucosamine hydrolase